MEAGGAERRSCLSLATKGGMKGQKEERKGCRPDLAGGRKGSSNNGPVWMLHARIKFLRNLVIQVY